MRETANKLISALAAAFPTPFLVRLMRETNRIRLSAEEIFYIAGVIKKKAPCRLLVFGTGNDSCFWMRLNRGGKTVFIEDDPAWLNRIRKQNPSCSAYLVEYGTRRTQWPDLIEAPERLQMELPEDVRGLHYDCILVDGPHGCEDANPGRMRSIFEASRLAGAHGDVFVHDCDREVERAYCDRYLGHGILKREIIQLRHYSFG